MFAVVRRTSLDFSADNLPCRGDLQAGLQSLQSQFGEMRDFLEVQLSCIGNSWTESSAAQHQNIPRLFPQCSLESAMFRAMAMIVPASEVLEAFTLSKKTVTQMALAKQGLLRKQPKVHKCPGPSLTRFRHLKMNMLHRHS